MDFENMTTRELKGLLTEIIDEFYDREIMVLVGPAGIAYEDSEGEEDEEND